MKYQERKELNGGKGPDRAHRLCLQQFPEREIRQKLVDMYRGARKRSKKKGRTFEIELEDVLSLYTEECPIFKTKLGWFTYGREYHVDDSPSLDRIDSSKGYVKGNIWIISVRANRIKSDASAEELMTIAKALMNR